jgi:PadR family transcriptional regulator PadR
MPQSLVGGMPLPLLTHLIGITGRPEAAARRCGSENMRWHVGRAGRRSVNFPNWQTQLRKGLLEMVLLNLLAQGESHGYEMAQRLKRLTGLEIREGNVYPVLTRLQMEGLVSTYTLASSDGPRRKYYRLTKTGEQVLGRMNEHWAEIVASIDQIAKGGNGKWKSKTDSGGS